MDREDIIKMAKEVWMAGDVYIGPSHESLEQFAELVRNDYSSSHANLWLRRIDEAVKAEREACAKFCETHQVWVGQGKRGFCEWGEDEFVTGSIHQGMDYAAAIRARGETK